MQKTICDVCGEEITGANIFIPSTEGITAEYNNPDEVRSLDQPAGITIFLNIKIIGEYDCCKNCALKLINDTHKGENNAAL